MRHKRERQTQQKHINDWQRAGKPEKYRYTRSFHLKLVYVRIMYCETMMGSSSRNSILSVRKLMSSGWCTRRQGCWL
jgi:hypothetical protein